MIIPRTRVCDICAQTLDRNVRYYKIKSKAYYCASGGEIFDDRNHDICEHCMRRFKEWMAIQETTDQVKADAMEDVKRKMRFIHWQMKERYGADITEAKADAFDELKAWLDKKTNGSSIEEDNG